MPSDILIPLATKTRTKMKRSAGQLFEYFKDQDDLLSADGFFSMCRFFLQIALEKDEMDMMNGYFFTVTGRPNQGLTKDEFEKILAIDTEQKRSMAGGKSGGKRDMAEETAAKINKGIKSKGIAFLDEIEKFQSPTE